MDPLSLIGFFLSEAMFERTDGDRKAGEGRKSKGAEWTLPTEAQRSLKRYQSNWGKGSEAKGVKSISVGKRVVITSVNWDCQKVREKGTTKMGLG